MLIWTIIFGVFTLVILWSQLKLQKSNFRLALYDKRYSVFLSAMQYITDIVEKGRVDEDELFKLLRNSKDKEFLFGAEVSEYIDLLYKKGVELKKYNSLLNTEQDHGSLQDLAEKMTSLMGWFDKQFDEGKRTFEAYLAIRSK